LAFTKSLRASCAARAADSTRRRTVAAFDAIDRAQHGVDEEAIVVDLAQPDGGAVGGLGEPRPGVGRGQLAQRLHLGDARRLGLDGVEQDGQRRRVREQLLPQHDLERLDLARRGEFLLGAKDMQSLHVAEVHTQVTRSVGLARLVGRAFRSALLGGLVLVRSGSLGLGGLLADQRPQPRRTTRRDRATRSVGGADQSDSARLQSSSSRPIGASCGLGRSHTDVGRTEMFCLLFNSDSTRLVPETVTGSWLRMRAPRHTRKRPESRPRMTSPTCVSQATVTAWQQ
jgi:hypothetical protein